MAVNDLTESQKETVMDLATLAMYADGHLGAAEDDRIQRLLKSLGYADELERNRCYDASVARVRRHSSNLENARAHLAILAQALPTREQRQYALKTLDDVITSDRHVSLPETNFMTVVREVLER